LKTGNPQERPRATKAQIAEIASVLRQESNIRKKAELCVGDLASIVGASDSAVSHQLRSLRNMDLVDHRREGKLTLYSLSDEHLKTILEQSLAHVSE
jgi:DNA-binding transcriptional ArsR family regulator